MKFFFFLLSFTLSSLVAAAPYQLKGSFYFRKGEKKPVDFNLRWVEKDGRVTGFYSDNRFTNRALVSGVASDNGRTFEILLPEVNGGVKSFSVLTASAGPSESGTKIPLQFVSRDMEGNPLSTARLEAQFTEMASRESAQAQEERPCRDGFGQLAGYCGQYGGMVSEEYDSGKLCDFLSSKNVRLELDNEANLIFHTDKPEEKHSSHDHLIGRVPSGPASRTVDIMSRYCRPLPGTNFPGDDCKRINLIGTFTQRNGTPHFTGTYSIIDEKNDRSCRYSMTFDRVNRI
ncbi:MAG: hypothetical protein ACJ76H_00585 [Bacteriovoracaceae bacterium]